MKYVAFVDILGFKEKINRQGHEESIEFLKKFSSNLYNQWRKSEFSKNGNIGGYIFSDSIIIYTNNANPESLKNLLDYLRAIFPKVFLENGVLLRAGIAKGNFENIVLPELKNLEKGLLIGKAFIEAYLLEGQNKGAHIQISGTVKDDIKEYFSDDFEIIERHNSEIYLVRWANKKFLFEDENLKKFVDLANKSGWDTHFYETLHLFLTGEKNSQVIFEKIYDYLKINSEKFDYNDIDRYLLNALNEKIDLNFRKMFLKYLRKSIEKNKKS